ncbi:MAG: hypothetical protein F9K17_15875 [Phycisphaerae bacterium]|nr:MAG: hypothetical protein F9K17_15875 [Phycisphaerae bacterium]
MAVLKLLDGSKDVAVDAVAREVVFGHAQHCDARLPQQVAVVLSLADIAAAEAVAVPDDDGREVASGGVGDHLLKARALVRAGSRNRVIDEFADDVVPMFAGPARDLGPLVGDALLLPIGRAAQVRDRGRRRCDSVHVSVSVSVGAHGHHPSLKPPHSSRSRWSFFQPEFRKKALIPGPVEVTDCPARIAGRPGACLGERGNTCRRRTMSKKTTKKVARAARAPKAAKTVAADKRLSGLDAAAKVLADAGQPMRARELVNAMIERGLWKSGGKTPHATIYAAMIREIAAKKSAARFKKTDRGLFTFNG